MHPTIVSSAILCTLISATAQDKQPSPLRPAKSTPNVGETSEIKSSYELRKAGRSELERRGGKEIAQSILFGLDWLAKHQEKDGRWDCDHFMHNEAGAQTDGAGSPVHDVGVTALALLAFLADGSTMTTGPFKPQVLRAVGWLRGQQDVNTGVFGTKKSHSFIYNHAIATLAMVEASALTGGKGAFREAAQKGLDYLEAHRNPYAVWRYQARDSDNDSSVTGWCVMAYAAGKAAGFKTDDQGLRLASIWFDQVTDPVNGRAGYASRGGRSSRLVAQAELFPPELVETSTAISLYCRFLIGQHTERQEMMKQQAQLLTKSLPQWNTKTGQIDPYYWFFGSHALYQMGGAAWDTWAETLREAVAEAQRRDKNFMGSWDPVGPWGEEGGRVYATAMHTMTLQSFYRHARVQDTAGAAKVKPKKARVAPRLDGRKK